MGINYTNSPILKRSFSSNNSPINKTGYCSHRPRLGRRFDTTESDLMYTCNTRANNKTSAAQYNMFLNDYRGINPINIGKDHNIQRFSNRDNYNTRI